jgi:hypothetical protein
MEYAVVGPLGGEVGALEVRLADGRRGVVKRTPDAAGIAARVAQLRQAGYPAPGVLYVGGDEVVWEWLPGEVEEVVDHALVDDALWANTLQAGMAPRGDAPWGQHVLDQLGEAGDVPLADTIRAAADGLAPAAFPQHDLMHFDFHHRNLLVRRRRLTAVVDWDGVRAGDRVFDLVTLAFCSAVASCQEGAVERLWERAHSLRPPGVIRAYAALLALRQLDWSIRRRTPADVESWTAIAERALANTHERNAT